MTEFRCQRCSWCCKNVNINVSYSDILRWSKENRLDILNEISYIDHEDKKKRGFYITETVLAPKRACPFLEETTCTIHDTEPRACVDFPEAFSDDEKEKIECPAKRDSNLNDEEFFELKKEQAFDFMVAEDRKDKIIRILEIAKTVFEGQKILKEFGEDPIENLPVDDFVLDAQKSGWTPEGAAPYLSVQDQPTNYVWTETKKAEIGDFTFANTTHSGDTLNSVTLYVYGQNADGGRVLEFYIWDGTSWTEYNLTPDTSWSWKNIAVPVLDTWTKVDGAELYIKQPNQADRTEIDAAYLLCDYTEAGATYNTYVSDSINISDTEYISVEFLKEVFVSDTVNVSDLVVVEHIYEIIDTYASDSVNVSDDVETETYKFFTSSLGDFIDVNDSVFVEKAAGVTKTVRVSDSVDVSDDLLLKGVTKIWNAPSNGNWETPSNWLPVGVPQEGDKVILNATSTYTCDINGDTENLESFLMDTGYTGTLSLNSYTLYVENTADTSSLTGTQGTLDAGTGTIKVSGDWDTSSASFVFTRDTSTIEVTGTGNCIFRNAIGVAPHNLNVGASGKVTTTTGSFAVRNNLTVGVGELAGSSISLRKDDNTQSLFNGGTITAPIVYQPVTSGNSCVVTGTTYGSFLSIMAFAGGVGTFNGAVTVTGDFNIGRNFGTTLTSRVNTGGYALGVGGDIKVGFAGDDEGILTCGASVIDITTNVDILNVASYLVMDTSQWTVSGSWTNNSTSANWDEGTSVIEFNGDATQTIANNDDDFYDIKLSGTGQKNFTESFKTNDVRALNNVTMKITHTTATWTTFNDAQMYADATYTLTLRSSSDDTQWLMSAGTGVVATRVDVQDSNNSGTEVDATDPSNTNSGNNDGWNFVSGEVKDVAVSNAVEVTDGLVITIYKFFTSSVADFIDVSDDVTIEHIYEVINKYISDAVNVSDSVLIEHVYEVFTKYISDTVNVSDAVQISTEKVKNVYISDSIDVSDSVWKELISGDLYETYVSDTVDVSDGIAIEHIYEIISKYVSDSVDVSDSLLIEHIYEVFDKRISDTVSVSDSVVTEHIYEIIDKYVSDSIDVSDSQTIEHIWEVFTKYISDDIEVSDATVIEHIYEIIDKRISDSVDVSDSVWKEKVSDFDVIVSDDIDVSDSVHVEFTAKKTIDVYVSDAIDVSDSVLSRFVIPRPDKVRDAMFILVAGTSTITVSDDMNKMNTRYALNEIPSAQFVLNDKGGKYSTMSMDFIVGNPIIISGSVDGGGVWTRLFSGTIGENTSALTLKKETINVVCSDDRLTSKWIDFNNSVPEYKNLREIMVGTSASSVESTWSSDGHGNYPDGLLHKTNLSYSGPDSVFPGIIDLPLHYIFGHETIYNSMKTINSLFNVSFYINPNDDVIEFLDENHDYPTFSQATISYGRDINKLSINEDYKKYAETIIVHGDGTFYQVGDGNEPIRYVQKRDLVNVSDARLMAIRELSISAEPIKSGNITIPAYTHSALGKRISIDDDKRDWSGLGNVVGAQQDISTDRWVTNLSINNIKADTIKTIADVLDEIAELKNKKDYSDKYDGFLYLDWKNENTSTDEYAIKKDTSYGGGYAGYPCILAVGTGTDTDSYDIDGFIYPYRISDMLPLSGDHYFKMGHSIPTNTNYTDSSALLKNFVIYYNNDYGAPPYTKSNQVLSRPASESAWTGSWNHNEVGTDSIGYKWIIVPPVVVAVEGQSFKPVDGSVRSRIAWQSYSDAQGDDIDFSLNITDSSWFDSGSHHTIKDDDKLSMSYDEFSKSENYFSYTHSVGAESEYVKIMFEFKLDLEEELSSRIEQYASTVVARMSYTRDGEATAINKWSIQQGKRHKSYGWQWQEFSGWESGSIGEWLKADYLGGELWPGAVYGGYYRIALSPDDKVKASTDIVIDVAYVDFGYSLKTSSDNLFYVDVPVQVSDDGKKLYLPYKAADKPVIYIKSDVSWWHEYLNILQPTQIYELDYESKDEIVFVKYPPEGSFWNKIMDDMHERGEYNWYVKLETGVKFRRMHQPGRYPEKIDKPYWMARYHTRRDNFKLPRTTFRENEDYEYYRLPVLSNTESDHVIWRTSSAGIPRTPAYNTRYNIYYDALHGLDMGGYTYKYVNFEGLDSTIHKNLTIQFKFPYIFVWVSDTVNVSDGVRIEKIEA